MLSNSRLYQLKEDKSQASEPKIAIKTRSQAMLSNSTLFQLKEYKPALVSIPEAPPLVPKTKTLEQLLKQTPPLILSPTDDSSFRFKMIPTKYHQGTPIKRPSKPIYRPPTPVRISAKVVHAEQAPLQKPAKATKISRK